MRRQSPLPPILTADAIGVLTCGWMLATAEVWICWLAYMLVLNIVVYSVARDRSTVHPGLAPARAWLLRLQRRVRSFQSKGPRILLMEATAGLAGYLVWDSAAAWVLHMGIANMLIGYWYQARANRPATGHLPDRRNLRSSVSCQKDRQVRAGLGPAYDDPLWQAGMRLARLRKS